MVIFPSLADLHPTPFNTQIAGQLAGTDTGSIEGKFRALEGDSQVDDELRKMKGLLTGSKEKSYLPPGGENVDMELEQLRREMGQ